MRFHLGVMQGLEKQRLEPKWPRTRERGGRGSSVTSWCSSFLYFLIWTDRCLDTPPRRVPVGAPVTGSSSTSVPSLPQPSNQRSCARHRIRHRSCVRVSFRAATWLLGTIRCLQRRVAFSARVAIQRKALHPHYVSSPSLAAAVLGRRTQCMKHEHTPECPCRHLLK